MMHTNAMLSSEVLEALSSYPINMSSILMQEANSNNLSEIWALHLVLLLAIDFGISTLQVYRDSLLVIQWRYGEFQMHRCLLNPLLHETLRLVNTFTKILLLMFTEKEFPK